MQKRAIINFYELSEAWQEEARRNLDEFAEETLYLEPLENCNPEEHVLWDLSECMPENDIHNGFEYNASITISNNSAMLLNIDDNAEYAEFIFV